ncbi:MAG: CoA transferase [Burkholderiaceae bacterium]
MLAGVRVVEFGQFIAAPGTTMLLADLGAQVIKVESLQGDGARVSASYGPQTPMYVAYNHRKRSIALNLRSPEGLDVARRLALDADLVVQNARAGVMERLGLDAKTLREKKPSLIYASVTGFGSLGLSRERPGLDIAAQAESGMMSLTGEPDGCPLKVGFAVVDAATTLALSGAIAAALFHRERTGMGRTIDTSLLEVAIHLQAQIWAEYDQTHRLPVRTGNSQSSVAPAADLIPVADGHIVISAYLPDHWVRLCQAIAQPEMATEQRFATNSARVANRPALLEALHEGLGHLSGEDARKLLESHGVVVGVVKNFDQVTASPDVREAGIFIPVQDGEGREATVPGAPYRFDSARTACVPSVPRLGEHSREILAGLDFDAARIDALIAGGHVKAG